MGLGGVAIAVLPSVVYPQTVVLGQAGGGITIVCGFLRFEFIHKIFIIDAFLCHNYLQNLITAAKIA